VQNNQTVELVVPERATARKKLYYVVAPNGCWEWQGSLVDGYGVVCGTGPYSSLRIYAHRYMYERERGPIPEGLEIDHLCRNRKCINPAHLEAVTHRENMLRGDSFSARHAKQTHCLRGHELTPENVYNWRRQRHCRKCCAIRTRKWLERQRGKKRQGKV
jgi:hypothetical protein